MITIFIADDHQLFRQGIAAMLSEEIALKVLGQANNGEETLEKLPMVNPDVLLLDVEMPKVDGIDVLRRLKKTNLRPKVLVLTMYNSATFVKNLVKAGASGYLKKDCDKSTLVEAIKTVHKTGSYFPPDTAYLVLQSLQEKKKGGTISPREKEVVELIAEGLTTKEIAKKLFLSRHTVESHRQNILLKLDLKNSAELVNYALKRGWA